MKISIQTMKKNFEKLLNFLKLFFKIVFLETKKLNEKFSLRNYLSYCEITFIFLQQFRI